MSCCAVRSPPAPTSRSSRVSWTRRRVRVWVHCCGTPTISDLGPAAGDHRVGPKCAPGAEEARMTTAEAGSLPERWDAVLEHRDRALRVARARLSDPYDVDDC